jgi:hypothetical protein
MDRLTKGKAENMSRLLKRKSLVKALDTLLPFPGLWKGFKVGYLRNILSLRCNDEIIRYMRYIYVTWNRITLGDPSIQRAVDIATVESL